MTDITFKKLDADALTPSFGSAGAAGLDLSACLPNEQIITILPGERKLIPTGLAVALPEGTYGRIAPRSGLAFKSGLDVMAGVIDVDYRGEIGVILVNLGVDEFIVWHGARIAQLIVEQMAACTVVVSETLPDTVRGDGAFGSTGE